MSNPLINPVEIIPDLDVKIPGRTSLCMLCGVEIDCSGLSWYVTPVLCGKCTSLLGKFVPVESGEE